MKKTTTFHITLKTYVRPDEKEQIAKVFRQILELKFVPEAILITSDKEV